MLHELATAIDEGKMSDAAVERLLHALHYERDIEAAARQGEVKGRNIRISKFLEQLVAATKTHSIQPSKPVPMRRIDYEKIGGLSAADRLNIWERGKERRVKH